MIKHSDFEEVDSGKLTLRELIKIGEIVLGGNLSLKIYGTLRCKSGKRMLKKNRVFFQSENVAIQFGFRPCRHCLPEKYRQWKKALPLAIKQKFKGK